MSEQCKEHVSMIEIGGKLMMTQTDTHGWEEQATFDAKVTTIKCKHCGKESFAWDKLSN